MPTIIFKLDCPIPYIPTQIPCPFPGDVTTCSREQSLSGEIIVIDQRATVEINRKGKFSVQKYSTSEMHFRSKPDKMGIVVLIREFRGRIAQCGIESGCIVAPLCFARRKQPRPHG